MQRLIEVEGGALFNAVPESIGCRGCCLHILDSTKTPLCVVNDPKCFRDSIIYKPANDKARAILIAFKFAPSMARNELIVTRHMKKDDQ